MKLSREDRRKIETAIETAERKTSGEIVVVITAASGTYFYVPFLWGSLLALVVPWPLIHFTWLPVQTIYLLQLGLFVAATTILHIPSLRYRLAPRSLKYKMTKQRAMEQFLAQNLHTKPEHTGVLLFVSVAERAVEILADRAINRHVSVGEWQSIAQALTKKIASGQPSQGLIEAVDQVARHLVKHFPPQAPETDILPNHLVILDT